MQIKNTVIYLQIVLILGGCSTAFHYGEKNHQIQSTTTFANDCQNPREVITLHPDGKGTVKLKDMPAKPISWKQQGRIVTLTNRSIKATAFIDDQKNLTLESSNKTKNKYIPLNERIRYRCLKKDT